MGERFKIEPQRDAMGPDNDGSTWMVGCAEAEAEHFALLRWDAEAGEWDLVDDYPTWGAAATAAVNRGGTAIE